MKNIFLLQLLLCSAIVIVYTLKSNNLLAQNPCSTAKNNGGAEYNPEWGDPGGLFICVSEVIPNPWDSINTCDCHSDCYYVHIRNNTNPPCNGSADIVKVRIIMVNDSTSSDICIGGALRQWTEVWDVKYAGTSTNFPTDTCISWGIDQEKAIDTKPGAGGNNVQEIGNHWTSVVCGSQSFKIEVTYNSGFPPPVTKTFGPFTLNTIPCPEFGNDWGWD